MIDKKDKVVGAAGLYGAILVGFFAAFLGGTNTPISGPIASMTAVSMVIIAVYDGDRTTSIYPYYRILIHNDID